MPPWNIGPVERGSVIMPVWRALCRPIIASSMGLFLFLVAGEVVPLVLPPAGHSSPIPVQRSGTASSSHVGAAMALLATLEEAHVLPPEGTPEADRVIKSAIQIQSMVAKSTDPAVREFLRRAVSRTGDDRATQALTLFQSTGWTPEVLEALAGATTSAPPDELQSLASGLGSFNLSVGDFRQFMQLVQDGMKALASEGRTLHEVFSARRKMMPGAIH